MTLKPGLAMRQSNMEFLRILAMLGIVAHHLVVHGGVAYDAAGMSPLRLLAVESLMASGKIGVDVFVLISGYFLSTSRGSKAGKVVSLWSQVLTYSLAIFAVFALTGTQVPEGTTLTLARSLLPVATQLWWFASVYLVVLVLSPFLNAMVGALDKGMMRRMLVVMLCMWSILPSLVVDSWPCGEVPWFAFLYCLAAYVRRYDVVERFVRYGGRGGVCILFGLGCMLLVAMAGSFVVTHPDVFSPFGVSDRTLVCSYSNILVLMSAFGFFLGFLGIDMGRHAVVNVVASATFGVYLIHDHAWVRRWLWQDVVGHVDVMDMSLDQMMPMVVGTVLAVFCACAVVDLVRQATIGLALRVLFERIGGLCRRIGSSRWVGRLGRLGASMARRLEAPGGDV